MEDLIQNLNTMDWSNIQEPVKLLICSMIKVISKQSNDIEELKANSKIMTLNDIKTTFHEILLNYGIDRTNFGTLVTKVDSLEKTSDENKLLIDNFKLETDYSNQQIETIAKQIDYFQSTLHKIETNITAEVEGNISDKILDINNKLKLMEIMHTKNSISKDELYTLLSQKAPLRELESTNEIIQGCVTKNELQKELNYQILPLTKALSSLEKLLQIQSTMKTEKIRDNVDTYVPDVKVIESIINTVMLERNFCDCKSVDIHSSITEIYERLLAEIRSSAEVLRLDLATSFNDEILQFAGIMDNKMNYSEAKLMEKYKKIATKYSQLLDKVVTKKDFEKWEISNSSKNYVVLDQQVFQSDVHGDDNITHPFDSFSEYSNIPDKSVLVNNTNRINREINELKAQLNNTKQSIDSLILNHKKENSVHSTTEDWRLALGDMTSNIKTEMKQKIDRVEMITIIDSVVTKDLHNISQQVNSVKQLLETKTNEEKTGLLQEEVTALAKRFMNGFAEGRWVCTNHNNSCIREDGFILWDNEMYNSVPSMFTFKKMNSYIQVKVPGLYRYVENNSFITSLSYDIS